MCRRAAGVALDDTQPPNPTIEKEAIMDTQDLGNALATDRFDDRAMRTNVGIGALDVEIRESEPSDTQAASVGQAKSHPHVESARYARAVAVSKRVRWDIDRDVIRQREFDFSKKFLPDGLSFVDRVPFLGTEERRLLSQIQGRSYANIFGLVERFIGAKILEVSRDHWLGDQNALEALVRFTDEELKHQELFRRVETMIGSGMPAGYSFMPHPNDVASVVLTKSTWSVLALTCLIELFTQVHYRASIEPDDELSPLFKDLFLFHWKEESQHAILDELEWVRENAKITPEARDAAVNDLIALVGAVDGILQAQAAADAHYFVAICGRPMTDVEASAVKAAVLAAYRWQYIGSGVQIPRFNELLNGMITPVQGARIGAALAPIVG
jgi:hypothetical protein